MVRDADAALPHATGMLFQQYILDGFCRMEASRMSWLRQNQDKLRNETMAGLQDFVENPDESAGPCYLDAIVVVRRYGRPDFFTTFIANPPWPEITAHLGPGQKAADRPDFVARVFHLKLQALLKELTVDGVLGRAVAWHWVIEFQKRGFPHARILLTISPLDRCRSPDDIDSRVAAELPQAVGEQSELAAIVRRCLVHGRCGPRNPSSPCMIVDGACC